MTVLYVPSLVPTRENDRIHCAISASFGLD